MEYGSGEQVNRYRDPRSGGKRALDFRTIGGEVPRVRLSNDRQRAGAALAHDPRHSTAVRPSAGARARVGSARLPSWRCRPDRCIEPPQGPACPRPARSRLSTGGLGADGPRKLGADGPRAAAAARPRPTLGSRMARGDMWTCRTGALTFGSVVSPQPRSFLTVSHVRRAAVAVLPTWGAHRCVLLRGGAVTSAQRGRGRVRASRNFSIAWTSSILRFEDAPIAAEFFVATFERQRCPAPRSPRTNLV